MNIDGPVIREFAGPADVDVIDEFGGVPGYKEVVQPRLIPVLALLLVECEFLFFRVSLTPHISQVVGCHAGFYELSGCWVIQVMIPTHVLLMFQGNIKVTGHDVVLKVQVFIIVEHFVVEGGAIIFIITLDQVLVWNIQEFDQELLLVECEQEPCKIAFYFALPVNGRYVEEVLDEDGNPPGVVTE